MEDKWRMLEVEETVRRWRDQYITAREAMILIDHQLKQPSIRLEELKMIKNNTISFGATMKDLELE